jgi:hypothetical protein
MAKQFVSKKIEEHRKESVVRAEKITKEIGKEKSKKKVKLAFIAAVCLALVLAGIGYASYSSALPGKYDGFAKCLKDKGAIMYGAEWCQYTTAQKGMFGKSFKYINYKNYDARADIKKTPTWEINGQLYENVQAFDRLASLAGCQVSQ